jgi:hypothetical protein
MSAAILPTTEAASWHKGKTATCGEANYNAMWHFLPKEPLA